MGFFKRIWKSLSTGDPEVAGGDPEARAILTEEYRTGEQAGLGEVDAAAREAEHATDDPAAPSV